MVFKSVASSSAIKGAFVVGGFVLSLLLSAASAGPACAGINVWTSSGPGGGAVWKLVIDPQTSALYAAADRGVFKSTNRGRSWTAASTGLPDDPMVVALAIDPRDGHTLYAGSSEAVLHAMPLASLLRAGIPIALGSDVNGVLNPFEDIMYAVTHPTNPAEALSLEEALAAHTSGAAFAEFAEHEKGRLLSGMLADLAVLSRDIFSIPTDQMSQTESVLTMVGGRVVYCRAQQVTFCPQLGGATADEGAFSAVAP